ncbi:MAG: N-acetylmuramoyl-L-alanine amidase [Acidihalobacter sp.]|jgi:N-acetylmuramoyl-L-alanine amidase|uniref:N-acetylmuramoyl-L-alanine amidase family protein n=1 Tax=Acidihalobacter sp. TaxID=1872108 RepID=UPI00307CFD6D
MNRRHFLAIASGIAAGALLPTERALALEPVITAKQAQSTRLRDVVVCIDPGHGGRDPGAIGHHGTYEKNVVLDMGHRLRRMVEAQPGMRPIMSRDKDRYVSLEERVYFAQKHKADLFIAIHADASPYEQPRGSSVYVFTRHGATSESARVLAESQNQLDRSTGVNAHGNSLLSETLFDLESHAATNESLTFGSYLMNHITHVDHYRYNSVQRAAFVVLAAPTFPSALVETAFISNPEQERLLRNPAFRERMATSLLAGIKGYFANHAPPGTLLAARGNALQMMRGNV